MMVDVGRRLNKGIVEHRSAQVYVEQAYILDGYAREGFRGDEREIGLAAFDEVEVEYGLVHAKTLHLGVVLIPGSDEKSSTKKAEVEGRATFALETYHGACSEALAIAVVGSYFQGDGGANHDDGLAKHAVGDVGIHQLIWARHVFCLRQSIVGAIVVEVFQRAGHALILVGEGVERRRAHVGIMHVKGGDDRDLHSGVDQLYFIKLFGRHSLDVVGGILGTGQ